MMWNFLLISPVSYVRFFFCTASNSSFACSNRIPRIFLQISVAAFGEMSSSLPEHLTALSGSNSFTEYPQLGIRMHRACEHVRSNTKKHCLASILKIHGDVYRKAHLATHSCFPIGFRMGQLRYSWNAERKRNSWDHIASLLVSIQSGRPVGVRETQRALSHCQAQASPLYHLEKLREIGVVEKDEMGQYRLKEKLQVGSIKMFLRDWAHYFSRYLFICGFPEQRRS